MSLFNFLRRPSPATVPVIEHVAPGAPEAEVPEAKDPTVDVEAEGASCDRVEADSLWTAFRENQVAAEARFGGITFEVEGVVDHVDRDLRGRIRVHFKVSRYHTLQALFPEKARDQVARLKPGKTVRVPVRVDNLASGYVVVAADV